MKKIYSFLMMAVMAIVMSFTAKADITVTLKIDDATRLSGYIQYTDESSYTYVQTNLDMTKYTGEGGSFTIPASYGYLYINATDGNCIVSAMNETSGNSANLMDGNTTGYFYLYSDATLVVTSSDIESTRTASCIVTVDDASKVNMEYNTGSKIKLVNGENIVKFNPNAETPFEISHANYGEILYSVKLNDVEQTNYNGRYQVTVANGDKLNIAADFPEEPATINFSYGEKETELLGCVSVAINGNKVEGFDGKTLNCMLGDKVTITGDNNRYNFNYAIYVDGASTYFYGSYEFTVAKTSYEVDLSNTTKYVTFTAYVTVDNIEYLDGVYVGNSNTSLTLQSGVKASIELSSNSDYINIMPATDCYIKSIKVNGDEYSNNYGTSSVTVRGISENDEIIVVMGKTVRDNKATVWVDDLNAALYGYGVQRYSDRKNVNLISGTEVTVEFSEEDNPYNFSFYQPTYCNIYQNNVLVVPQYVGSTSYYISLVDGDKIRVYLASEPAESVVTFEKVNFNGDNVTVTVDGKVYANWEAGFTVLSGTEISVTGAQVIANGAIVSGDGTYTFIANEAETNVVLCDNATSIEDIATEEGEVEYYNLQGVKVENPEKGVFIKKQGGKTTKVVL